MSASRVLHAIAARRPPLLLSKLRMLLHYRAFTRKPVEAVRYLLLDTELDNFTYEIGNLDELASFLADGLGVEQAVASSYLDELQGDEVLRRELTERLRGRFGERARVAYGRRLGWYAAVRIRKPRVAVQTGTHHGLGSAVLLSALARNAAEGEEGVLLDLDVRADTGWLVPERLEPYRKRHVGDPRELLPRALEGMQVDFFVHDSDHAYAHELYEWETVFPHAAAGAVLISDAAHSSTAFADFFARQRLETSLFLERPLRHFYPGAGIGLAVVPGRPDSRSSTAARL